MDLVTAVKKARRLGLRLGIKKFLGYEAIFSCAFRPIDGGEWMVLPHSEDYWYADPLIYARDGRHIVYMERVDRHTGIGSIVASDITDGAWTPEIPVISEPFHMSFPMIFEWNDALYMIPETEMDQAINLYRCREYPYKWDPVGRFLRGTRLVDSVVEDVTPDRVTLLGSDYLAGDDFYTRFHRYALERDANGVIKAEDCGVVSEDYTLWSRMAGYPMDGVFPVQRSTSGVYGYSVMFIRNDPAESDVVEREILPKEIDHELHGLPHLIGVHTYSRSDRYEVIDIQYLVKKVSRT